MNPRQRLLITQSQVQSNTFYRLWASSSGPERTRYGKLYDKASERYFRRLTAPALPTVRHPRNLQTAA